MKHRCLIVDDEPIARRIVHSYCEQQPAILEVVGEAESINEMLQKMEKNNIDILFLDINMPGPSGLDWLRMLNDPKLQVIITTAHSEFAVEVFGMDACDYLLKPFSFERFTKAVNRAIMKLDGQPTHESFNEEAEDFFVKADGKLIRMLPDDILYCEALGNYTKIYTTKQLVVTYQGISTFESLLSKKGFLRIHRSYIINRKFISAIEGNQVFVRDTAIPIGGNYRDAFYNVLGLKAD
jgi:DNA-binding LytR/AlgR family response regulator